MAAIAIDLPLTRFLSGLFDEGRAVSAGAAHATPPSSADRAEAEVVLARSAKIIADDAPLGWPGWDPIAGWWAATALAWASGMVIDRSETNVEIPKWIKSTMPRGDSASHHASVDVAFRFAADVLIRAQKIGDDDPLLLELTKLMAPWPLATVGTNVANLDDAIGVVMSCPATRMTMIDRIILRGDSARAADAHYVDAVAHVVGGHPGLKSF